MQESLSTSAVKEAPSARESEPSPPPEIQIDPRILVSLLQVESQARSAQTVQELCFVLANETRRLVMFQQALACSMSATQWSACQVEAVSSLAVVDRKAPMVRWVEQVLTHLWKSRALEVSCEVTVSQCPKPLQADWSRFAFPHVLWCPLIGADHHVMGGMWLAREAAWSEGETQLVGRLSETVAHAWQALGGTKTRKLNWKPQKKWVWGITLLLLGAMCLPVRLSTLAPVEIIARNPSVVTAPLDGVVEDILIQPNTAVEEGQVLFRYDDTTFRNQYEVAEKNLSVALREYRKVSQGAFLDDDTGANMPVQASQVRLKEVERDYAWEVLQQVEVTAPQSGIVIFGDKSEWIGRPVVIGERIMEVADPKAYELKVDLAVEDAIVLRPGAEVDVFLNASPLQAVSAELTHASYHANILPNNILAYRVKAEFTDTPADIRIGWQGTAKVYGEEVSVFFYLFRRPLSVLRQSIGF